MANLPSNDVSIMLVRNAINCPSTDLGTLCSKAKIGGKSGFAFSIKENGNTAKDGYMIADSLPYWNIYIATSLRVIGRSGMIRIYQRYSRLS